MCIGMENVNFHQPVTGFPRQPCKARRGGLRDKSRAGHEMDSVALGALQQLLFGVWTGPK
jgi:hypothetical protein